MISRRVVLWLLTIMGGSVGAWALFLPKVFYDTFPDGLALTGFAPWVALDGPYNEHLVRDVGAFYLALAAAGLYGLYGVRSRDSAASRIVGVAWVVFSIPHFLYHVTHLHHFEPVDAIAQSVSLAMFVVLGVALLLPDRTKPAGPDPAKEPRR